MKQMESVVADGGGSRRVAWLIMVVANWSVVEASKGRQVSQGRE